MPKNFKHPGRGLLFFPQTQSGVATSTAVVDALTVDEGVFVANGTDAQLKVQRAVVAAAGTATVAGTAASLKAQRAVVSAPGSFVESGTAATVKAARVLTSAAGSYVVTGTAATVVTAYPMPASAGAVAVTGQAAALKAGRVTASSSGSFAWSGASAATRAQRTISSSSGAYSWSGTDAALVDVPAGNTAYTLTCDAGTYGVTGTAATFAVDSPQPELLVVGSGGGYARVVEEEKQQAVQYTLAAESGSFRWMGTPVTLTVRRVARLYGGTATADGTAAALAWHPVVRSTPIEFDTSGGDAALNVMVMIRAESGVIVRKPYGHRVAALYGSVKAHRVN